MAPKLRIMDIIFCKYGCFSKASQSTLRDPAEYRLRKEAYDIAQVAREGGPRQASLRVESSFLSSTLRDVESANFRASYGATLAALQEIINLSAKRGIQLNLIINPIHARQNYALDAAGLWPLYENWKRDLVAAAQRSPRPELVSLSD